MYAIVRSGGKQYKTSEGELLRIEKLDAKVGDTVSLDDILLISDGKKIHVGKPSVKNAKITCEILRHGKYRKVLVFKHRRRKNYRRKSGHRQQFTELRVKEINLSGGKNGS